MTPTAAIGAVARKNEFVTRVKGYTRDVWCEDVLGVPMFRMIGRVPFQTHRVCLDFSLVCLRLLDGRLLLE